MVTLTGPDAINQLASRHLKRFADMANANRVKSAEAGRDLETELQQMHSGQPSGQSRVQALIADDHPFARRHGAAMWQTPPIGVVTGTLLGSLSVDFDFANDSYTITGKSTAPYAKFLWSPYGTRNMVPRGVSVAVNIWAEARMIKLGFDLMADQRSLL
jgi:hypothetical protein